jgi:hypothetical protein
VTDNTLRIGWTRAQSDSRRGTYRRLLGFNLLLQAAIGLAALAAPVWVAQTLGLPEPLPAGWVRIAGLLLLVVTVLYLPGWIEPVHARWPNMVGIAARAGTALLYLLLGSGFLWLAAFDALFAVLLAVSYTRLLRAELMSLP